MQEYSIQRSQRRCHQTERTFAPGENYFSAITARGGELRRTDYAVEAWKGPPEGAIGWWRSVVPPKPRGAPKPAPAHVLLAALESMLEEGSQPELTYLLALLLVRRRILSEPGQTLSSDWDSDAPPPTHLHLQHGPSQREWMIPICEPALDESGVFQDQLSRLLFCDG